MNLHKWRTCHFIPSNNHYLYNIAGLIKGNPLPSAIHVPTSASEANRNGKQDQPPPFTFRSFQLLQGSQLLSLGLLPPLTCPGSTFLRSILVLGFWLSSSKYYWMNMLIPWFLKNYNIRRGVPNCSIHRPNFIHLGGDPYHALLKIFQLFNRSQDIWNESMSPVGRHGHTGFCKEQQVPFPQPPSL